MSEYTVEVKYYVNIEAENAEEAEEKGYEISLDVSGLDFVKENRRYIQPWDSSMTKEVIKETMDWTKAEEYLNMLKSQYASLIGEPQANPFYGLAVLDSLLKRYNSGERTQELYDEMMSSE